MSCHGWHLSPNKGNTNGLLEDVDLGHPDIHSDTKTYIWTAHTIQIEVQPINQHKWPRIFYIGSQKDRKHFIQCWICVWPWCFSYCSNPEQLIKVFISGFAISLSSDLFNKLCGWVNVDADAGRRRQTCPLHNCFVQWAPFPPSSITINICAPTKLEMGLWTIFTFDIR